MNQIRVLIQPLGQKLPNIHCHQFVLKMLDQLSISKIQLFLEYSF